MIVLRTALADTIKADLDLSNLLSDKKVYAGEAIQGNALPYVVIGQILRDADASYLNGHEARGHVRRLTVWAKTPWTCEDLMVRLIRLLDHTLLTVAGHVMQSASLSVVFGPHPSEKDDSWGLTADWTVKTVKAAA